MQLIRIRTAAAVLALALATPLAAQEAPATAPEAPAAQAPAAPGPAPSPEAAPETPATEAPAAGAPAAEAPAQGAGDPAQPEVMEIVKDTFGDWQVRCAPDGKECFMYQLAVDAAKNPVAEVSILKLPEQSEADAGVTVVTPLGTLLTTGVIVQIDGGEKRQYPFAWCSQVGCFARFGLTKPSIDTLKRGKAGTITLVSVGRPEAPVVLTLSLSGFTAAFDTLETPVLPAGAVAAPLMPDPAQQPAARPAAAPAKPLPDLQPKR